MVNLNDNGRQDNFATEEPGNRLSTCMESQKESPMKRCQNSFQH